MDLLEDKSHEKQLSVIRDSLLRLAADPTVQEELPEADLYGKNLKGALRDGDLSLIERSLLDLYELLHRAGSTYSTGEKTLLAKRKGYACHPGGLSPLVKAVAFLKSDSVVADLGAGNGLQGLLLQRLCPHRKTIQVEISSEMIRVGRIFQRSLGIGKDRVEWVHGDIVNAPIEMADFVYTYLPVKPVGEGKEVYEAIAHKLGVMKRGLVVFSVADCLSKFLDGRFSIFYTDGHLTCFAKECRGNP
jgi:SAM-dependent methyltransferase